VGRERYGMYIKPGSVHSNGENRNREQRVVCSVMMIVRDPSVSSLLLFFGGGSGGGDDGGGGGVL